MFVTVLSLVASGVMLALIGVAFACVIVFILKEDHFDRDHHRR